MDLPTTKCIQIKYSDSLFAVKTGPDTSRACFDFSPTGTAVHYFPDSSLRLMARARVALKYETTVLSTRTSPAIRSPHTYLSSRLKKHMDLQKQGIKCAAPTQEERAQLTAGRKLCRACVREREREREQGGKDKSAFLHEEEELNKMGMVR